jgi:hypothetical protein
MSFHNRDVDLEDTEFLTEISESDAPLGRVWSKIGVRGEHAKSHTGNGRHWKDDHRVVACHR